MTTEEQKAVASQEGQDPSQEQKQEASEANQTQVTETPEFQRAVQSEADKRAKVLERKLEDIKAEHRIELRKLEERLESDRKDAELRREDGELDGFLNKYVQSGDLPESSVPPIRDWAKKILDRDKQARDREAKATESLRKAEEKEKEVADIKATRAVLRVASEAGISLTAEDAETIAKKTQGNLDWAADLVRAKGTTVTTPETPTKSQPKRPAGGGGGMSGGKMSVTEVRQAYIAGRINSEKRDALLRELGVSPGG